MSSSPELWLKVLEAQLRKGSSSTEHQPRLGRLGALLTYCPPRQYTAPPPPESSTVQTRQVLRCSLLQMAYWPTSAWRYASGQCLRPLQPSRRSSAVPASLHSKPFQGMLHCFHLLAQSAMTMLESQLAVVLQDFATERELCWHLCMTLGLAKQHERLAKALAETGINEKQQPLEYRAQAQVIFVSYKLTHQLYCVLSA